MAMDTWGGTEARQLGSIVQAPALSGPSANSPSETISEPLKPTPAHKRAIAELALRFPAGNTQDPDQYQLRLEYLAKDCAHIAVPLLRAACDRAAQVARGLPYASEILACAAQIVEERQRAKAYEGATFNSDGEIINRAPDAQLGDPGDNVERCRERNMQLMREGATYRVFPVGAYNTGRVQVEDDGAIWPTHACTGDGMFRNLLGKKSGLWPQ